MTKESTYYQPHKTAANPKTKRSLHMRLPNGSYQQFVFKADELDHKRQQLIRMGYVEVPNPFTKQIQPQKLCIE